jgi:ribosomal protein S7
MIRLQKRVNKRLKSILFLFVNKFIKKGKKEFVYKIFCSILIKLKHFYQKSFDEILNIILETIKPLMGLKPKFASGIIYYLPTTIAEQKAINLGLLWLVKAIRQRRENFFRDRLLGEFKDILEGFGFTLKFKQDYYKMILDNRVLLYRFKKK